MIEERKPVLFVYGPGAALRQRLEQGAYPFSLQVVDTLLRVWPLGAALLVFVPDALDMLPGLASSVPVLACGPLSEMERAFGLGAADFLISPLITEELKARASRLLCGGKQRFASLELLGLTLSGNEVSVMLNLEDTRLLKALLYHRGTAVSRAALRDLVWPDLDRASRMPDIAVSRLRKHFRKLGVEQELIHTVRGFGYMIQHEAP
jgi:DNA-binding response OmpR family regulator